MTAAGTPWSDVFPFKFPVNPYRAHLAHRFALAAWALAAVINLGAGVVIALQAERQSDLDSMRRWGKTWLAASSPYFTEGDAPEYPPHAILVLSPLGVIPDSWAVPTWALFNVALAFLAPYLAMRTVRPGITLAAAAPLLSMFLCWGGFRTLLQFSLLSLTLGLLTMVLADKRPLWSGVCLALALMKPQMSAPFVLWALFTRRWRLVCVAGATVFAGTALFCLRVDADPFALLSRYVDILRTFYLGDAILVGLAQMRPLVALLFADSADVDGLAIAIALVLLAGICVAGFTEGVRRDAPMYSAPALAGLWSLLTFYHLTYGFILLLPAAALLALANEPWTRTFRRSVFWVLQLGMMVDVPGVWRRFGPLLGSHEVLDAILRHADRALMLALFACVAVLAARARAPDVRTA